MKLSNINWAKQHDWFIESYECEPSNFVAVVRDEFESGKTLEFSDVEQLAIWAGY